MNIRIFIVTPFKCWFLANRNSLNMVQVEMKFLPKIDSCGSLMVFISKRKIHFLNWTSYYRQKLKRFYSIEILAVYFFDIFSKTKIKYWFWKSVYKVVRHADLEFIIFLKISLVILKGFWGDAFRYMRVKSICFQPLEKNWCRVAERDPSSKNQPDLTDSYETTWSH